MAISWQPLSGVICSARGFPLQFETSNVSHILYLVNSGISSCGKNDNTCDYGDTCTLFIPLIIKGGVMNTPFGGYACGWLKIIILRDGEH